MKSDSLCHIYFLHCLKRCFSTNILLYIEIFFYRTSKIGPYAKTLFFIQWAFFGLFSCTFLKPQHLSEEERKAKEAKKLYQEQMEIGQDMAGRLLAFYKPYQDDTLTQYIDQVGLRVAKSSDYPNKRYIFGILDTPTINAFACPGGYILITKGALAKAETEAELAMILGHEITHVGKDHVYQSLSQKSKKIQEKKPDQSLSIRARPQGEEITAFSYLAQYLSGANNASLSVLQAAKNGMNLILEQGLDPKLEFEADHEGLIYAMNAGYEPNAFKNFLTRLSSKKNKKDTETLSKTHPNIFDRIQKIDLLLKEINSQNLSGIKQTDRFLKAKKSLSKGIKH